MECISSVWEFISTPVSFDGCLYGSSLYASQGMSVVSRPGNLRIGF